MSDQTDQDDQGGTETETLDLIEKHGISRRVAMAILGGSAMAGAMGGIAAGNDLGEQVNVAMGNDQPSVGEPLPERNSLIDPQFGLPVANTDQIPDELDPDHVVELHVLPPSQDPLHPPLFHFSPVGLCIEPGDIVQFTATTPDHTISSYHNAMGFQQRVPDGTPPFSSPVLSAGGAWLYQFINPGLYDYYCGPHHVLGMAGRIFVGDAAEVGVPDYEDIFQGSEGPPPILAPFSKGFLETELNHFSASNEACEWPWLTPHEVLATPALDPVNICANDGTVSFDEVLDDIGRINTSHDHS